MRVPFSTKKVAAIEIFISLKYLLQTYLAIYMYMYIRLLTFQAIDCVRRKRDAGAAEALKATLGVMMFLLPSHNRELYIHDPWPPPPPPPPFAGRVSSWLQAATSLLGTNCV